MAELDKLGLLPGTPCYNISLNWQGQPLWRTPPPGELLLLENSKRERPTSCKPFWIHPIFVWAPETLLTSLFGRSKLPCMDEGCTGEDKKKGLGRPRVLVGSGGGTTGMADTGQYYIMASKLRCNKCNCYR